MIDLLFALTHSSFIALLLLFITALLFILSRYNILDLAVGENFFHLDLSCACSHFLNSDHPVKLSSRPISCYHVDITSTFSVQITGIWNNRILEISSKIKPTCWNTIHLPAKHLILEILGLKTYNHCIQERYNIGIVLVFNSFFHVHV